MIIGKLTNASEYLGIHPLLDRAISLLTPEYLEAVPTETRYLDGENLYVTRFDYETVPFEDTFYESHKKYLDIQIVIRGREWVDIAHPAGLTRYENKGDFYAYRGEADQRVLLSPGTFLVVFPGDAHRLKISVDGPEGVSKVVFKLRVYE